MDLNKLDIEDAVVVEKEPTVVVKKPMMTVKINARSPFTPQPYVFLGGGDVNKRYQDWLEQRVKKTLSDLGEQYNKKGQLRKEYIQAVNFMRTLVFLAESLSTHEGFQIVYDGVKLPKPIDFTPAVRNVVDNSKELFLALKSYYQPVVSELETTPA